MSLSEHACWYRQRLINKLRDSIDNYISATYWHVRVSQSYLCLNRFSRYMYHYKLRRRAKGSEWNEEASSSKVHDYLTIGKRKPAVTFAAEWYKCATTANDLGKEWLFFYGQFSMIWSTVIDLLWLYLQSFRAKQEISPPWILKFSLFEIHDSFIFSGPGVKQSQTIM